MGVPKFYKMVLSQIPGITTNDTMNPFSLNVDTNGILHKIAGSVFGYGRDLNNNKITPEKLNTIIQKLRTKAGFEMLKSEFILLIPSVLTKVIITQIGPTDVLNIAIDGVPVLAKIIQQQMRRFLSGYERFIKAQGGQIVFDTSYLTGGTSFMKDASTAVQDWINENKNKGLLPKYTFFSSSDVPGEGEHKLFKMLDSVREYEVRDISDKVKTKKNIDQEFRNQVHVFYGLDADLGILTMLRDYNFMWIREKFDIDDPNVGVSIVTAKKFFIE